MPKWKDMTGNEIRRQFLDFFAARGHRVVRSSPLVPANDPTLLFANAGMNQFKDVFTGVEKREYVRAASSQKCVRAGGKHNDLENVGYTRRHHTFFEMLGNFSFGDYFKAEAIAFAWELLTRDWGLAKDRLYVTVFREDDEAARLWTEVAGVPASRIFRMDEKDNFWQMGETGPCGPCSEIHYDLGPEAAEPGREQEEFPEDGGGRFMEIWNLVFMQFERSAEGKMTPLPRPSIDTGMGLERIASVLQGKLSNYECDLLSPIVDLAGRLFGPGAPAAALRINADHARAAAFLIHDGVLPSNEGRGYVLRKIIRRALRHGRLAGRTAPYLAELTAFVARLMEPGYPEMIESIPRVSRVVTEEEHRYASTFQVAEKVFFDEARSAEGGVLPGAAAFKLYDTYGLALDEQRDLAREHGLMIDEAGFEAEMEKQRRRARASWKGAAKAAIPEVYRALPATEFIGRETLEAPVRLERVIEQDGRVELLLDVTPFYAEAGGQVGDRGVLVFASTGEPAAEVEDTYKPAPGAILHKVRLLAPLKGGEKLIARVDGLRREAIMRNHTATHLLHAALRRVLGGHVKQAGSVVDPNRLRFDFTHYAPVHADELAQIERLANREILENIPVRTDVMELEEALKTGAMALFGEKYGEKVRVVTVDDFSRELCGGTHVKQTGDIGVCKIVSEGGISAGVRRIEAITGGVALERFQEALQSLGRVSSLVGTSGHGDPTPQIEKLIEENRALEKQLEQLKARLAQARAGQLEQSARTLKGVKVLAAEAPGMDRAQLRALADSLRAKWKTAVVVLASTEDANVSIVTAVTKDLTGRVHAGKIAGALAQAVGGKGGGRPDMAEAGGKDPAALAGALDGIYSAIEAQL
jgi:alanyl-tRNA synthetase